MNPTHVRVGHRHLSDAELPVERRRRPTSLHPVRPLVTFDDEVHQISLCCTTLVEDSDGQVTIELLRQLGAPGVVVETVEALTQREGEARAD
jgi:hypothetical protein